MLSLTDRGEFIFKRGPVVIHHFHVPVMGTAFTIDTPIKTARFGISSVMSIGDDELCEVMREHYSSVYNLVFEPIKKWTDDFRAKRITAYLDLVHDIVEQQIAQMKTLSLSENNDLSLYFKLLHDEHPLKKMYHSFLLETDSSKKEDLETQLKLEVQAGSLDVNIMTKIDRTNYAKDGTRLSDDYSDALSALRGFAKSKIHAGIVFSAGFNRRLYSYIEKFDDFFPDSQGFVKKWVIMKVSDFRSSMTQGKFLAKKGVWIKEHRIESGLNCGGHAFASTGYLLGPILEEFKQERSHFVASMLSLCNEALAKAKRAIYSTVPETLITVQGGIGTSSEQEMLLHHYGIDRTGWASPFLLVEEVTTLDDKTRELLRRGREDDFFLSEISPLGVPFNTIKGTDSELLKQKRFEEGNPGSPCPKGHLVSNIEFTDKPICTASKLYQRKKISALKDEIENEAELNSAINRVVAKACLCEDLAAGAIITNNIPHKRVQSSAVCPGPNLAYFSKFASLAEMVDHIYGRTNLLNDSYRPHMFIKELKLYVNYFKKEVLSSLPRLTEKQQKYLQEFRSNLADGIAYYTTLIPAISEETATTKENMSRDLLLLSKEFEAVVDTHLSVFS